MNMIEQIDKKMKLLRVIRKVVKKLPDVDWSSCIYQNATIVVHSMEELHEIRGRLRAVLGGWNDTLKLIWASGGCGVASYENPDVPVEIWLEMPMHDFPPELMGDGCGFEKRVREGYDYVCKVKP